MVAPLDSEAHNAEGGYGMRCFVPIVLAMVVGTAVVGGDGVAPGQTPDMYGGYPELPVAGGATEYFRVAKTSDRWTFVTPNGNTFWLRAVYGVDVFAGGTTYVEALKRKHVFPQWVPWEPFSIRSVQRIREWGFNALGEYIQISQSSLKWRCGTSASTTRRRSSRRVLG